jgi:hypothetical protein
VNHFTWADAVVAMGITSMTKHPSQIAAAAVPGLARPMPGSDERRSGMNVDPSFLRLLGFSSVNSPPG